MNNKMTKRLNYTFKPLRAKMEFEGFEKVPYSNLIAIGALKEHLQNKHSGRIGLLETDIKLIQENLANQLKGLNRFFSEHAYSGKDNLEKIYAKIKGRNWQSTQFFIKVIIESTTAVLNDIITQTLPSLVDEQTIEVLLTLQKFDSTKGGRLMQALSQIYYHLVDTYIEEVLIPQWTVGKDRASAGKKLRRMRYLHNDNIILIGFIGTKEDADQISSSIKTALMSEVSVFVIPTTQGTEFLGAQVIAPTKGTYMQINTTTKKRRPNNG